MAGSFVPLTQKPKGAAKDGEVGLGHSSPGLVLISPARTEVLERRHGRAHLQNSQGKDPDLRSHPITPCPATAPGPAPRSAQSHSHATPVSLQALHKVQPLCWEPPSLQ